MDFNKIALEEAQKSKCNKRKVGAVIVDITNRVIAKGHNHTMFGGGCEDENGNTFHHVIHAEIAAINKIKSKSVPQYIYVTHPPCDNCAKVIKAAGLELKLVEDFMKFDTGKLRYDLVPPIAMKELAKVLTYGAKKYKPNNWKLNTDKSKYIAATMRHFEDYRNGQIMDPDGSGLKNLSQAFANIAFLIHFEDTK